tara:strand:- start:334 stop:882 length:549 start_codon:yes stop_codon:yes gene_type:complete
MSFGQGSNDSIRTTTSTKLSNNYNSKKKSKKRNNNNPTKRMARELYGDDKYSSNTTTTSSSSSSFRTKTQKRDDRSRHSNFLESEMRKQDMLIREQDSSLEMLSSNLTRLGDISHVVSRELDEQAILLDDLDLEVEKAEDGLTRVNLLAKDLIRKSGGPGWFCLILFLSMIALFLFFLVVYT